MPCVTAYLFACDRGIEGLSLPTQISRYMGDKARKKEPSTYFVVGCEK